MRIKIDRLIEGDKEFYLNFTRVVYRFHFDCRSFIYLNKDLFEFLLSNSYNVFVRISFVQYVALFFHVTKINLLQIVKKYYDNFLVLQ